MDDVREREVARGLRNGDADAWRESTTPTPGALGTRWRASSARTPPTWPTWYRRRFWPPRKSAANYDPWRGSSWLWLWDIARRRVALHYRNEKRHDRLRNECRCDNPDGRELRSLARFVVAMVVGHRQAPHLFELDRAMLDFVVLLTKQPAPPPLGPRRARRVGFDDRASCRSPSSLPGSTTSTAWPMRSAWAARKQETIPKLSSPRSVDR